MSHLCNFSGENTNTTKEIFFGGVFLTEQTYESLPCVKGGGSRKRDGGIVKKQKTIEKTIPQSPTVTAPFTQGSLKCTVSLLIVVSGFCPIWRGGHPRAMLAPEKIIMLTVLIFYAIILSTDQPLTK